MPAKLENGKGKNAIQIYPAKTDNVKIDEPIDSAPVEPNLIIEVITDHVNIIQCLNKSDIKLEHDKQFYTTSLRDRRNSNRNHREADIFILYKMNAWFSTPTVQNSQGCCITIFKNGAGKTDMPS